MTKIGSTFQPKKGFALIAVLLALATLTALFAVTSSHVVSARAELRADQLLLSRSSNAADLMRLAANWKREADIESMEFGVPEVGVRIRFQDIGGLIDLNTARPELIDAIAKSFGVDHDGVTRFRAWRRSANRLLRVEDFYRLSGFSDVAVDEDLRRLVTVHSGRPGIALDYISSGLRARLADLNLDNFDSPATGTTFLVESLGNDLGKTILGVIHIPASGSPRILRMN
ncbi:MAG: hypothetical protein ABJR46_16590 [Tateyamaria sp.]|uniref:hypothetical protein n=1 Tax=Tateyamaria sp. TaxID=1929288 RepID=UPI00329D18DD